MAQPSDAAAWFGLTDDAADALRAAAGALAGHSAVSAWRARFSDAVRHALGAPSQRPELAALVTRELPDVGEVLGRQLPLVGLADALPSTVGFMRRRGIADPIIRASLEDVGRTERKNHVWFGRPGLDAELAVWLTRHLHGALYQLGRLQFERVTVGGTAELVLSIHIPAGLGPMPNAEVDASLTLARTFFPAHFPDEDPRRFVCISWLLDPQLAEYLPAASNIVSFQGRFALDPLEEAAAPSDDVVRRFVFGTARVRLAEQSRSSTLERAIHEHLSAGRHFVTRRGWFDFDPRA